MAMRVKVALKFFPNSEVRPVRVSDAVAVKVRLPRRSVDPIDQPPVESIVDVRPTSWIPSPCSWSEPSPSDRAMYNSTVQDVRGQVFRSTDPSTRLVRGSIP